MARLRPMLFLLVISSHAVAQSAPPQPDEVSMDGFEPGLVALAPRELDVPPGYAGPGPGGDPLRVVLSEPAPADTFVAIASSDPRVSIPGGGAVVVAGNTTATFTIADAGTTGSATPVLLTATLGTMRRHATVRIASSNNESNAPPEADFCNIQFPPQMTVSPGASTQLVYGQLYEAGATEPAGPPQGWLAQLGWGAAGSDPRAGGWRWSPAFFNVQTGNNDEFGAQFTAPTAPGVYAYVFRFSNDLGASWTYCDLNGAGANAGLSFELPQAGRLDVQ